MSEGGLAVAAAEMAFAGGLGMSLQLDAEPQDCGDLAGAKRDACLLFSESNTRFVCEVPSDAAAAFEKHLQGVPHACLGRVTADARLEITSGGTSVISAELAKLKAAWQSPLDW